MIGGESGNDGTEDPSDVPATTKTDYKIVEFVGRFNGVLRRWGFCYINLHHKASKQLYHMDPITNR